MRRMLQGRAGMGLAFLLGVVIATAGTATAAKLITGKQIKDGSISAKDLSRALRSQIARAGPGPAGTPGVAGPQGPAGSQGIAGPPGASGAAGKFSTDNVTLVRGPDTEMPAPFPGGNVPQSNATCPAGAVALSGFWEILDIYYSQPAPFFGSYRQPDERTWSVNVSLPSGYPGTGLKFRSVAVCATGG